MSDSSDRGQDQSVDLATAERLIQQAIHDLPASNCWWVGFSGGLDSTLLLHALVRYGPPAQKLRAVHVNHQISTNASHWELHCQHTSEQLDVPLVVRRVDLQHNGQGLEATAREARYQVFAELLAPGDCLLLGHHLSDQAETVLYRLIQGHGLEGLAAIPRQRALGSGQLLRPLMDLSRQQLESLAAAWQLSWVEDESNQDEVLARNFLRHQVLPVISSRWPAAEKRFAMSAEYCREALELTRELAAIDLTECSKDSQAVSLPAFRHLSRARRKNLLRYWLGLDQNGLRHDQIRLGQVRLGEGKLNGLMAFLHQENPGESRFMLSPGVCVVIHDNHFSLLQEPAAADPDWQSVWHPMTELLTPLGLLKCHHVVGPGLRPPQTGEQVTVRFRQGGERFSPAGRGGSCSLKKWLQEARIPPWDRERLPLVFYNAQLVAVADKVLDERYRQERYALRLQWLPT